MNEKDLTTLDTTAEIGKSGAMVSHNQNGYNNRKYNSLNGHGQTNNYRGLNPEYNKRNKDFEKRNESNANYKKNEEQLNYSHDMRKMINILI